jgi:hypothetical protein
MPGRREPAAEGAAPRPVLRVVRGDATPEEIAALLAIFAVRAQAQAPAPADTSTWGARRSSVRDVRTWHVPGPHGWRTSYWPR